MQPVSTEMNLSETAVGSPLGDGFCFLRFLCRPSYPQLRQAADQPFEFELSYGVG